MKRIVVIANKWWEARPLVEVLTHPDAAPREFSAPWVPISAGQLTPGPRLIFSIGQSVIEVWCLQDLMDPNVNGALSPEKARVLHRAVDGQKPDLVIGFSTCATPLAGSHNGCAVMGSSVFVHDPFATPPYPPGSSPPTDPAHYWTDPQLDTIVKSSAEPLLGSIAPPLAQCAPRTIQPPNGAGAFTVYCDPLLVATSVVNVLDPRDYAWADPQALSAFAKVAGTCTSAAHETTLGLIRLVSNLPFLYVAGIANAVGKFSSEVVPNAFTQNLAAANNAAVALAWSLPRIAPLI